MQNRIRHLLNDWQPELPTSAEGVNPESASPSDTPDGMYAMPRGINMLMPVELCINRSLMISLLSASIAEMLRHKKAGAGGLSPREEAELDAALQQQLAFRSWIKDHPMSYISMALYPVTDADPADELDGLDDLDLPGA